MRSPALLTVLSAAIVLAGCASTPAPTVPLRASVEELVPLRGEWSGGFTNPTTGRAGTITMRISAEDRLAVGEVVLSPDAARPSYLPANESEGSRANGTLLIRFLRVEGARVSGVLEPYRDPECGCILSTSFEGTIRGDVVEGLFVTNGGPFHASSSGTWRIERHRPL